MAKPLSFCKWLEWFKMLVLCKHLPPATQQLTWNLHTLKPSHLNPPTQWLSRGDCKLQLGDVVQQLELVAHSATPTRSEIGYAPLILNSYFKDYMKYSPPSLFPVLCTQFISRHKNYCRVFLGAY